MDRLIGVLRRPDGLVAVVSRRLKDSADETIRYEVENVPLDDALPGLVPDREDLLSAWNRLANVRRFDADVAADVIRVLGTTIGLAGTVLPPAGPITFGPTATRRVTAAHPRAFRGTTVQPPTPPSLSGIDCRRVLCSAGGVGEIMKVLEPVWSKGVTRLWESGLDCTNLSMQSPPNGPWDIYLAVHHGLADGRITGLPDWFASHFLWSLRGAAWSNVQDTIELLRAINAPQESVVRLIAARLVSSAPVDTVLGWLRHIVRMPQDFRAPFLAQVIANEAAIPDPTLFPDELVDAVVDWLPHDRFDDVFEWVVRCTSRGVSSEYVSQGLSFPNLNDFLYSDPVREARFDIDAADKIASHLDHDPDSFWGRRLRPAIWERCGKLPILADVLRKTAWFELPPRDADRLLRLYLGLVWISKSRGVVERAADHAMSHCSQYAELLTILDPAYRSKAIEFLERSYACWDDEDRIAAAFPDLIAVVERLAGPPFASQSNATPALITLMTSSSAEARATLAAASDRVFITLEKAVRRRNDASLIEDAIDSLCAKHGEYASEWFIGETRKFLSVMQLLGALRSERRVRVVTSVFGPSEFDLPPNLDRLQKATMSALADGMPSSDHSYPSIRHALQLRGQLSNNRTAYRKFLRAHLRGDMDYIQRHPLNQQWLAKHPVIDAKAWMTGASLSTMLPGTGVISLSLEQDPLEVLRLGTYVGSCLGSGGPYVDSAVAVTLDVNKAVVYARNRRGSVLARQQVALSEQDTLVCFHVYPGAAGSDMKAAFADFDRQLARKLGIAIHADEEYEIANPVSHYWYDDDQWALPNEKESQPRPNTSGTKSARNGAERGIPMSPRNAIPTPSRGTGVIVSYRRKVRRKRHQAPAMETVLL